jgi:SulP family sulfate permease
MSVTRATLDADFDDQNRGFGGESLEAVNQRLKDGGITLHLSEVKGPVMDRLKRSHFLEELTGKVHLTQYDAVSSINPDLARRTREAKRLSQKETTEE